MKGVGPKPMITPGLLGKSKKDIWRQEWNLVHIGVLGLIFKRKKSTFLFEIGSKKEMDELLESGFNSLYEYDGNFYCLYDLWRLANRSVAVEEEF